MLFWFMKKGGDSCRVAKDRLRMVLVNDRMNIRLLENIKYDIIGIMKNYMDIDEDNFSISITQTENKNTGAKVPMLFANFPIRKIYKN
ncbi:MAG: cell division topological specificity factor MinE [Firmicutes bacterium]|nr:cell division topological specificity factor MinE [Bacillota bacterium]MBQ9604926.1 cell division topological specificity factor MinE [Bacillota bacterium]